MAALDSTCMHSGCMATKLRDIISNLQATIDMQATQIATLKRRQGTMASIEVPDGITFANLSLWCEVTDHAFSAKDPDMVVMNYQGQTRLSCGQCAGGLFSVPTDADVRNSGKKVRGAVETRVDT